MKQHILKKVPLFVTVSVLLTCIVFSGCAGRTVITDAQFKSACEAADCEVTDVSDQFDSSVITKALTVSGDDYSLGFFTFASTDSAKTNYAQMLSSSGPPRARRSIPANTTATRIKATTSQRYSTATALRFFSPPARIRTL